MTSRRPRPGQPADSRRTPCRQALAVLEEIVIPGTDVLDIKDEAEVAKRLRVRVARTASAA